MPSSWIIARPTGDGASATECCTASEAVRVAPATPAASRRRRKRLYASAGSTANSPRCVSGSLPLARTADPCATPTRYCKALADSRVDLRESTTVQHRTALGRVLPTLGDRPVESIAVADVAELVAKLAAEGKARESIRKSVTALAMVLDFAGIQPNPARDRIQVRLPRQEPEEPEPPNADVEAVGWLLPVPYLLGLLALDATGARVGELEAARVGDLDEMRRAWQSAAVAKTAPSPVGDVPTIFSPQSSTAYRLVRTATQRRRSSLASPPTACAWRSVALAAMPASPLRATLAPPPQDQPLAPARPLVGGDR